MLPRAAMETVLVVGATGNIHVSAITAALRSIRNVLAIVRTQNAELGVFPANPEVHCSRVPP